MSRNHTEVTISVQSQSIFKMSLYFEYLLAVGLWPDIFI